MENQEKATYRLIALNTGLEWLEGTAITANHKNCHYPIYDRLRDINKWLEDHAGNRHAFGSYYLDEYGNCLHYHYVETRKKELDRLAKLAKRDMMENIWIILRKGADGKVNII